MTRRPGVVLLDALLALVLVAVVSLGAFDLLRQSMRAREATSDHARRLREVDRLLSSVAMWPRGELDLHLGRRRQGTWWLDIQRSERGLYRVSIVDGRSGRAWLSTVLGGA
ncbi:MAG: hypothetical protein IT361_06035 [Gemmatimonadaceae bacterium]|nr:hypothetical protein [Gemmatimonadaceae bacterium]